MQKKNIIRSLGSFMLFPAMTLSMPVGPLPASQLDIAPHQVILAQLNIESSAEKAIKEAEAKKAQILQAQADAIDAYYRKYDMPLLGQGLFMAKQADLYDLDYRLIPALSVAESTGGRSPCKNVENSFLGYGSCKMSFKSTEHAIEVVARSLGGENENTARYYKGKTTEQIISIYNPERIAPGYKKKVLKIMEAIGPAEIIIEANS